MIIGYIRTHFIAFTCSIYTRIIAVKKEPEFGIGDVVVDHAVSEMRYIDASSLHSSASLDADLRHRHHHHQPHHHQPHQHHMSSTSGAGTGVGHTMMQTIKNPDGTFSIVQVDNCENIQSQVDTQLG